MEHQLVQGLAVQVVAVQVQQIPLMATNGVANTGGGGGGSGLNSFTWRQRRKRNCHRQILSSQSKWRNYYK
jgi:hypothetical protein